MEQQTSKDLITGNYRWAILIGAGLALSPIHNYRLTELVTRDGEVGFFLPAFGTAIWLMASLLFVVFNWHELNWGDKRIYVPLLVIVGAIGISGITADRWQDKISPILMGLSLFALYLVARRVGKDMFLPLAIGAGVASLGIIIYGLMHLGAMTGGFVFEKNYDIATGYILLGMALLVRRHQWMFASLALVAMFISGSPEAVVALSILGLIVLARRDWGKRLAIAVIPVAITAIAYFSTGYGQMLYGFTMDIAQSVITKDIHPRQTVMVGNTPTERVRNPSPFHLRITIAKDELAKLKPLGIGYIVTDFSREDKESESGEISIIHNIPLVIVQQLGYPGILAGFAWMWVCGWCLVKTKWRYVWVLILALSIFDHYIWTQMGTWWWAIIGVSTASQITNDKVFR